MATNNNGLIKDLDSPSSLWQWHKWQMELKWTELFCLKSNGWLQLISTVCCKSKINSSISPYSCRDNVVVFFYLEDNIIWFQRKCLTWNGGSGHRWMIINGYTGCMQCCHVTTGWRTGTFDFDLQDEKNHRITGDDCVWHLNKTGQWHYWTHPFQYNRQDGYDRYSDYMTNNLDSDYLSMYLEVF